MVVAVVTHGQEPDPTPPLDIETIPLDIETVPAETQPAEPQTQAVQAVEVAKPVPPRPPQRTFDRARLEADFGDEALEVVNKRLQREVELLARAYRDSTRKNNIVMLIAGGGIALVFFAIGFAFGRRGGRRRFL